MTGIKRKGVTNNQMKIQNQVFHAYKEYDKKRDAERMADQFRYSGFNARVVKTSGGYTVYKGRLKKGAGEPKKR